MARTKKLYVVYLDDYSVEITTEWDVYTMLAERDHGNRRRDGYSDKEYLDECREIVMNDESYSSEWLDFMRPADVLAFFDDEIESYKECAKDAMFSFRRRYYEEKIKKIEMAKKEFLNQLKH